MSVLRPYIQPDIFEFEVSQHVGRWVISYFDEYKEAPGKHIQDIYVLESSSLKSNIKTDISQYLTKLSEEYLLDGDTVNDDFIIDQGRRYLKDRHLRKLSSDMTALLDIGRPDEAEKLFDSRKRIIEETTYRWTKPLDDPSFINSVFEESEEPLLRLKGDIGNLMGDLHRGWLVGIMGPMKRGKTWSLQDIALDAVLSRKRVAMLSFEMKDRHLAPRFYKQIGGFGDEDKNYVYPCFDCLNNQDNSCNKVIRKNRVPCPSRFDPNKVNGYKPCTACRKVESEKRDFLPGVWHFVSHADKLTLPNTRREIRRFNESYGRNRLRMISFPAFSASMKEVKEQLYELVSLEGFVPDVIVTDYASIMRSERNYTDPRHSIEDIFKEHKQLAQEMNALVVTGVQALGFSREALTKDMQDEKDIGLSAYILAHVDIMMTLDQTPEEKETGVWRMGIIEHRWRKFNKRRQVMVLQQLELGIPVMDTEIIYWSGGKKNGDEE